MKIHKQTIANGHEWKPCIDCGHRFEFGEIITAIANDTDSHVYYWYCSKCFEQYWFSPLPVPVDRDDDFCMVVIKDNKVQVCPKRMSPAEYMKRKMILPRRSQRKEFRRSNIEY